MSNQQPNWEQLIQGASQNYHAQTPFERECFRSDLADGVAEGIVRTMTYEQRMELARTKWKFAWQFFVICVFFRCFVWITDKVEPYWNMIDAGLLRSAGMFCIYAVAVVLFVSALVYGFVKIYRFILNLLGGH
jgi:hypothetical protein